MYTDRKILPVELITKYQTLTFIHDTLKEKTISNFKLNFNSDIHEHNTRNSSKLHLKSIRTSKFGKNSIAHFGFKMYNELPEIFKTLDCKTFRKNLKQRFLDNDLQLHFPNLGPSCPCVKHPLPSVCILFDP